MEPGIYTMISFVMILKYYVNHSLKKLLFLCSKKAVKDVTDQGKICILDVDRQVSNSFVLNYLESLVMRTPGFSKF